MKEWLKTHHVDGRPVTTEVATRDSKEAERLRDKIVAVAAGRGKDAAAQRLLLEGIEGYPGADEVEYLADILGGTMVIQPA